jgi:nitrate reductase delta subunit
VSAPATVLQAASLLLQYPDDRVRAAFAPVRSAVSEPCLRDALDAMEALPPLALQEHYVRVLDERRQCCLYLTWWTEGETRRRGLALARLKELYRARGFELVSTELPDFLPVVLEFAASHVELGLALLQENRAALELLRLALVEVASPYAGPVQAVCDLLPGPSPQDVAAARALARTGPPTETVGLDGYGFDAGPTSLLPTGARP